jgi:hypothetical protein
MANLLGYAASCAVLATFLMRTMVPLRLIAILSNILFLLFGYIEHIYPVFFLHVALLPINTWRLLVMRAGAPVAVMPAAPPSTRNFSRLSRPYALWFAVGLFAGIATPLAVLLMSDGAISLASRLVTLSAFAAPR